MSARPRQAPAERHWRLLPVVLALGYAVRAAVALAVSLDPSLECARAALGHLRTRARQVE